MQRKPLLKVNFASIMLTNDEKSFVEYWQHNRLNKKKVLRQLYVGLPLGVVLAIAIFVNFFSGWYKRADMKIKGDHSASLILVLIAAVLLIIAFIVIFSARHRWDINEQRYRELLLKKDS
jgi:membrane protein YdbS with pleckstrin-like domain